MAGRPLNALEQFKALEEHIAQLLKKVDLVRQQKGNVEKELAEARRQIKVLQKELDGLQKERVLVKGRVERLIESISKPSEKQIV